MTYWFWTFSPQGFEQIFIDKVKVTFKYINFTSRDEGKKKKGGGGVGGGERATHRTLADIPVVTSSRHSHYCLGDKDPHPGHIWRQFSFAP